MSACLLDVRLRAPAGLRPSQEPRSITAKFEKPHLTLSGHINMLKYSGHQLPGAWVPEAGAAKSTEG
jgi:hypothetical protein